MVSWFILDSRNNCKKRLHRREQIIQVMRQAARHAAQQVLFVHDLQLLAQADLVEQQSQVGGQFGQQPQVVRSEKVAVGLWAQQHQADQIVARQKTENRIPARRSFNCWRASRCRSDSWSVS